TFYVGGEVVNYYGDSGGGSTLIVKSIDANGNFQIAHKSYVSYGIPSRSDLTYAYFMDIQMEGNTLTMSASARYAAQGKQFIRYTLEPASLSITKNEFNPLDNTFWAKYQRTDVLKVDNKGLMAYNADVNGINQLKMSIRESENNYKEITLFDSVPE
ncbi:hypothetical protein, partial [Salmonella enterica]